MTETREVITLNYGEGFVLELVEVISDSNVIGRGSKFTVHLDMREEKAHLKPCTGNWNYAHNEAGKQEAKKKYLSLMTEIQRAEQIVTIEKIERLLAL